MLNNPTLTFFTDSLLKLICTLSYSSSFYKDNIQLYGTPKLSGDVSTSLYYVPTLLYYVPTLLCDVSTLLYDVSTLLYYVSTLLYYVSTLFI